MNKDKFRIEVENKIVDLSEKVEKLESKISVAEAYQLHKRIKILEAKWEKEEFEHE